MKKEGIFMSICPNRVTIYRLTPEEVERHLLAKYGGKIAAVNTVCLAKQNQRRARYAAETYK